VKTVIVKTDNIQIFCRHCGKYLGTLKDYLYLMMESAMAPAPKEEEEIKTWLPGSFIYTLTHTHIECDCDDFSNGEFDLLFENVEEFIIKYIPSELGEKDE